MLLKLSSTINYMYFVITSTWNVHKYTIQGSIAKKDNCALGDEPKKDQFETALASFWVHNVVIYSKVRI